MTIDGVSDAAQFEITKVKIMSFETVFLNLRAARYEDNWHSGR